MGGASESGTVGYGGRETTRTQTNLSVIVGKGTKHVNLLSLTTYLDKSEVF